MPRPDITIKYYDLNKGFSNDEGVYNSFANLYAWYQFDVDISTAGKILFDKSINFSRKNLTPEPQDGGSSLQNSPAAPTSDSPSETSPRGFPKRSSKFFNDANGSGDMLEFVTSDNSAFSWAPNKQFSTSTWVKFNNLGGNQCIMGKWDSGANKREWFLVLENGKIVLQISNPSRTKRIQKKAIVANYPDISTDKWVHILTTYNGANDSSGIEIYINGNRCTGDGNIEEENAGGFDGMTSNDAHFSIGNFFSNNDETNYRLKAQLAEIAIWDAVLPESSIKALARAPFPSMSGILTNPIRTKLIDIDNRGKQYPQSSIQSMVNKKKSHNFSSNSQYKKLIPSDYNPEIVAFDDTNSLNFKSAFPTAEIEFVSPPRDGEKIELTISGTKTTFEIQRGDTSSAGSVLVDLKKIAGLDYRDLGGNREERSRRLRESYNSLGFYDFPPNTSPRERHKKKISIVARLIRDSVTEIAKVINDQNLTVSAISIDNRLILKSKIPYTDSALPSVEFKISSFSPLDIFNYGSGKVIRNFEHFIDGNNEVVLGPMFVEGSSDSEFSIIDSPNKQPTIKTTNSEIKPGTADGNYFIDQTNRHEAFDDSLIHIDDTDDFYTDGTPFGITPGFSSPLKSKTQIVIQGKSSNIKDSAIFFSTGSKLTKVPSSHKPDINKGSGVAYWSPVDGNWDMLGDISDSSDFDPYKSTNFRSAKGVLAFTPDNGLDNFGLANLHKKTSVGQPITELGFPLMGQYNAGKNNCINMSDYITEDFLLEKISVELKGSFGLTALSADENSISPILQKQFFILNQFTDGDNPHHSGEGLEYNPKLGPNWLENELAGYVAGATANVNNFQVGTNYSKSYSNPLSFDRDLMAFHDDANSIPGLLAVNNFKFSADDNDGNQIAVNLGTNSEFRTAIPSLKSGDWTSVYTDIEGLQELIEVGSMSTLIGDNAIARVNNVELETEAFSTCLNGNSTGYLQIADKPRYFFPSDGEFSLSVWVYHEPGVDAYFGIVAKRTHTPKDTNREWVFWHRTTGYVLRRYDESADAHQSREFEFDDHNISQGWHHFLITDGPLSGASANDDMIFYVDGVQYLPASTTGTGGNFENSEDLTGDLLIGSYSNSNTMPAGFKIADVALFNRVVTQNEAKSIYNHGRLVNPNRVIYPKPLAISKYGADAAKQFLYPIDNYEADLANMVVSELTSIDFANDSGPNSGSNRFTAAEDLYTAVGEISTSSTITVDDQTVQISLLNQFDADDPQQRGERVIGVDPVPDGGDPDIDNPPIARIEMVKELTSTGEVSTFHADITEAVRMIDNLLLTVSNIEIDNKADTETKFQATHSDSEPLTARVYGIRTEPIKNLGKVSRGPLGSTGSVSEPYRMSIKVPAVLTSNGFAQTYTIRFLYHDRIGFADDDAQAQPLQGDDIVSAYNSLPSDQKSAPGQVFVSLVHSYDKDKNSTSENTKFHPVDLANRVARAINGPALNKKLGGKYEELGQIGIIYGPTDSEVGGADNFGLGTSYLNSLAATPSDSGVASARAVLDAAESNLTAAQVRRDLERDVYDYANMQLNGNIADGDSYSIRDYISDLRSRPGAVVNEEDVSQVVLAVLDFEDRHNRGLIKDETGATITYSDGYQLAEAADDRAAKVARDAANAAYDAQLNVVTDAQSRLDGVTPDYSLSQNADHAAFMELEGLPNGGGIPPLLAISKGSKLFIYTIHANGIAYDLTTSRSSPGELISNIDLDATKDFLEYPSPDFKEPALNQATTRISVDDQNNQNTTHAGKFSVNGLNVNGGEATTNLVNVDIQGDLYRLFDGATFDEDGDPNTAPLTVKYDGIFKKDNFVSFLKDKSKVLTYKMVNNIGAFKNGSDLIYRAYIDVEFQPEKSVGAEPFSIPEPTIKIDMGSSATTGTGDFNNLAIDIVKGTKNIVIENILDKDRMCLVGDGNTILKIEEIQGTVDLSFDDATGISFSVWVYHKPDVNVQFGILSKQSSTVADSNREWHFYFENDNTTSSKEDTPKGYVFKRYDESRGTHQGRIFNSTGLSEGWHHFFVTDGPRDGGSANDDIRIFVDGVLKTTQGFDSGTYVGSENLESPITIGGLGNEDELPEGVMISDISIWNQELIAQSSNGVYHDQLDSRIDGFYQRVLSGQLDSKTTRLEILPGEKVTFIKKNILVFRSESIDPLSGATLTNKVSYFVDDIKVFDDSENLVSSEIVPTNQQAFLDLIYMDSESSGLRAVVPNENMVTDKFFIELPIDADVMVSEYPPLFYTGPKHGSAGRAGNAITLQAYGNNAGELYGEGVLSLATTQQFFGDEVFTEGERIKLTGGSEKMNHAAPAKIFKDSDALMNTAKFLGNNGLVNFARVSNPASAAVDEASGETDPKFTNLINKLNKITVTNQISISAIFSLEEDMSDGEYRDIINMSDNDAGDDGIGNAFHEIISLGLFKEANKDPRLFFSIAFEHVNVGRHVSKFISSFSLTKHVSSHTIRTERDNDESISGKFYHVCVSYDASLIDGKRTNLPVFLVDGKEYTVNELRGSLRSHPAGTPNVISKLNIVPLEGTSIQTIENFCIGNNQLGTNEFPGRIGESLIWSKALSRNEMQKLSAYYKGLTSINPTTTGYRELVGFAKIGFTKSTSELLSRQSAAVIDPENEFLGDVFDKIVPVDSDKFIKVENNNVAEDVISESSYVGKINFNFEPTISTVSKFTSIMPLRSTKGIDISSVSNDDSSRESFPIPAKYKDNSSPAADAISPDSGILSNPFGGASGTSSPSGRQLVSSIISTDFSLEDNLIATQFDSLSEEDKKEYGDIFSRQKEVRNNQRRTSPYLIKPTDRLIFGWQNHSFNPTHDFSDARKTVSEASEFILGEQMFDFIESIKVTLFGSNVSSRKESHGGVKDNLTSNSLHQIVGDDPVLDQFDVSNIEMLSGSYIDALMFGTMIKKGENGRPVTGIRGRRGSLASHHGGPTGSLQRNIKHSSTDLVYADTQLPYFGQIIATLFPSASSVRTGSVTLEGDVDYGSGLTFSDANPAATAQRNITWPNIYTIDFYVSIPQFELFPYIGVLENSLDISYVPAATYQYSPAVELKQPDAPGNFNAVVEKTSLPGFETPQAPKGRNNPGMEGPFGGPSGGFSGFQPFSDPTLVGIFPQSDADFLIVDFNNPERKAKRMSNLEGTISRLGTADTNQILAAPMFRQFTTQENLFGVKNFDDDSLTTVGSSEPLSITATEKSKIALSKFSFGISAGRQRILYSGLPAIPVSSSFFVPQPRGFKYGVMNTPPLRPFNIYRRDRYGQFRDMLEQHPETHFNRDSGRSKVIPSVIINYVSREGEARVDPESTNTQNLSIFATSSRPYSDGDIGIDRITTQPDLLDQIDIQLEADAVLDE